MYINVQYCVFLYLKQKKENHSYRGRCVQKKKKKNRTLFPQFVGWKERKNSAISISLFLTTKDINGKEKFFNPNNIAIPGTSVLRSKISYELNVDYVPYAGFFLTVFKIYSKISLSRAH